MPHPLGEEYEIFCELNPCPSCMGQGMFEDEDGVVSECPHCAGTGLDPTAEFESDAGRSVAL